MDNKLASAMLLTMASLPPEDMRDIPIGHSRENSRKKLNTKEKKKSKSKRKMQKASRKKNRK